MPRRAVIATRTKVDITPLTLINHFELDSKVYDKSSSRLYSARKAKNLTIEELAKLSKVSPGTIGLIELGQHKPSLKTLRKLSQSLDVQISYLGNFDKLPENTLGQRIKKARLYHGLSQNDLADLIGVGFFTIVSWEKDTCIPQNSNMIIMNKYLQILVQ